MMKKVVNTPTSIGMRVSAANSGVKVTGAGADMVADVTDAAMAGRQWVRNNYVI